MLLPPDPAISTSDIFVPKHKALNMLRQGAVDRLGPRLLRVRLPEKALRMSREAYARFLLPVFNFAYPANLPNLADDFQRCMTYPVVIAREQRSFWEKWADLF